MVVEDDPLTRRLLVTTLEADGYNVLASGLVENGSAMCRTSRGS